VKLFITVTRLSCEAITADDANNPLAAFDSIDYYVYDGRDAGSHQLKQGNLGEWRKGQDRTLSHDLWHGELQQGQNLRIKFMDDDLLLDDFLGELEVNVREGGTIDWIAHQHTQVIGETEGSTEIHLTGSGARYQVWLNAHLES